MMVLKIFEKVVQNFMEFLKEINHRRNHFENSLYEKNNKIIDTNIWLNFKCASYRSLYDSSSHFIIDNPQKYKTLDEFKHSVEYFSDGTVCQRNYSLAENEQRILLARIWKVEHQ